MFLAYRTCKAQNWTTLARATVVLSAFAERKQPPPSRSCTCREINLYANRWNYVTSEHTNCTVLKNAPRRFTTAATHYSGGCKRRGAADDSRFNMQFGYEVDELFGNNPTSIVSQEDGTLLNCWKTWCITNYTADGGNVARAMAQCSGRRRSQLLDDEKTEIVCSLRIFPSRRSNVEPREAIERQKELVELKTRFVSMVSHEQWNRWRRFSLQAAYQDYADRRRKSAAGHTLALFRRRQRLTELLSRCCNRPANRSHSNCEWIDFVAFAARLSKARESARNSVELQSKVNRQRLALTSLLRQIVTNLLERAILAK